MGKLRLCRLFFLQGEGCPCPFFSAFLFWRENVAAVRPSESIFRIFLLGQGYFQMSDGFGVFI